MATYPYISGTAGIVQTFAQLRKGFPAKVDAGYLQRFNIASGNEFLVIAILRFLGLIDEDGNRVADKTAYFFGSDDTFKAGLEETLHNAYSQLFNEMGDGAFSASKDDLAHWFRGSDRTSELTGQRQASTFQNLAALAGHGDMPNVRSAAPKAVASTPGSAPKKTATRRAATKSHAEKIGSQDGGDATTVRGDSGGIVKGQGVGLTVRIEVNLPPDGDATTYDAIFASIKKHLMS